MRTTSLRRLSLLILLAFASSAWAADSHPLWSFQGKHNTVYLLGSIHVLSPSEQLPAVVDQAYKEAEVLVMEVDMDDLDPLAAQQAALQYGLLPENESLADHLDAATAAKLETAISGLGVPSAMFNRFRPWLAAITLTQLQLLKLGLNPQSGVEQRFVAKAAADGKEIQGLETLEEQLGLLANLPPRLQVSFLTQTIEEGEQLEREVDTMLNAWRTGDGRALEKYLERAMREHPDIYKPLTVDRNRRWMSRLESIANERDDYLVIVGVLHLVGDDGVVDMLERRGYRVRQH